MPEVTMKYINMLLALDPFHVRRVKEGEEELARKREIDEINLQIREQAARVADLKDRHAAQHRLDPDHFNGAQMHITQIELEAAERVFFTLFNRLRELHGMQPLIGTKFTGEYNYATHIL